MTSASCAASPTGPGGPRCSRAVLPARARAHARPFHARRRRLPRRAHRSDRFGLKWLRADLPLEEDYVVTIEPGIYFIPALLDDPAAPRGASADDVNWERVDALMPFGGMRIEDDVRVTAGDPEVLSAGLPKSVAAIEELRREAFAAVSASAAKLTITDVARVPRPGTVVPGGLAFTPDGNGVCYLFSEEGTLVRSLWRYDLATGERRVLAGPPPASTSEGQLSRDEELRRERARLRELGVTSYQWAQARRTPVLLVPGGGKLYAPVGDAPAPRNRRRRGRDRPAPEPRRQRAWRIVRDGELFVADVAGGRRPAQLTSGAEDGLTNGLAEFIAQEELDQRPRLLVEPMPAPRSPTSAPTAATSPTTPSCTRARRRPDIEHHRTRSRARPNAYVTLAVVDVASARPRGWISAPSATSTSRACAGGPMACSPRECFRATRRRCDVAVRCRDGRRQHAPRRTRRAVGQPRRRHALPRRRRVLCDQRTLGFRHIYLLRRRWERLAQSRTASGWSRTSPAWMRSGGWCTSWARAIRCSNATSTACRWTAASPCG